MLNICNSQHLKKTDGGGEERGWERKEYKVKDEDGEEEEKIEIKMRIYIVYCILKFRRKIVARVCVQGRQFSSKYLLI